MIPTVSAGTDECFNPCFNGSCSRIGNPMKDSEGNIIVSILVLMDLAREYVACCESAFCNFVSILVLMDLAREFKYITNAGVRLEFQSLF